MQLREALGQIAEIRERMATSQTFRGYRSATTAISGVAAVSVGLLQSFLLPDPAQNVKAYIALWASAALLSLVIVAIEMVVRVRRSGSAMQRQLSLLAVEQFMPSVVAGALLTYVIYAFIREATWLLPGLWMILFALGVFASSRLLPRASFAVAGFYLLAGVAALVVSRYGWAYSPWLMAGGFGTGQFAMAAILYLKLEKVRHEPID